MGSEDRRPARVVINTTRGVKERLERVARRKGWSLSKAANLALVEGLKVLEADDERR